MSAIARTYRVEDLIRQSSAASADPIEVMRLLRYGPALENNDSSWRGRWTSSTWVRVSAMSPAAAVSVGPIEEILLASISGTSEFEIVAQNSGTGTEVELFLGFADARDLSHAAGLVAPHVDFAPSSAPAEIDGSAAWHRAGIVHRLEAHGGAEDDDRQAIPLLGRLAAIPGPWQVSWQLRGASMTQIDALTGDIESLEDEASARRNVTVQTGPNTSVSADLAGWGHVQDWLSVIRRQLTSGRATGLWSVETHVQARDARAYDALCSAFRHAFRARERQVFATGVYTVTSAGVAPASVLTSEQLGRMFESPAGSIPGLRVRPGAPRGRVPTGRRSPIDLGTSWGTGEALTIDVDDLVGHAFVTGTTGSGKTTTVTRLLSELWNRHGIPFLIIDPVKNDYSRSAAAFTGGLTVVTGSDLKLDALRAWPGEDPAFHVARLSQAFRGAFTLPTPVPYVVSQLFDLIVEQESGPELSTLFDLRAALDPLVRRLGYAPEIESNIRAALMTRLNLLLSPSRAGRFNWADSQMVAGLFDRPTVVTLADLGDDEERSFAVLLLALATWQAARARGNPKAVEHVLVLEEAHRVIPELGARGQQGGEVSEGSAQAESAALLTSLLSEVRSYGEQVIVIDQSPAKVSQDVVRNTNLKIVHRLLHPDDQAQAAGSIGLDAARGAAIGGLAAGQALVSSGIAPEAQAVAVAVAGGAGGKVIAGHAEPHAWPCCSADQSKAGKHFRAWNLAPRAEEVMALAIVGLRIGEGDGARLRAQVYDELGLVAAEGSGLNRSCLAWVGLRSLLVRERVLGRFATAGRYQAALDSYYEDWASRSPLVKASGVPNAAAPCPACGERCRVRVPASVMVGSQPVGGLYSTWRRAGDDLEPVIAWVAGEAKTLSVLLGDSAAWELLRCMAAHVVVGLNLPRPVIDHVVTAGRSRP